MAQIIEMATQNVKNGFEKTYLEKYIGNGQIIIMMNVNTKELITANLKAAFNLTGSLSASSSWTALAITSSSVKISNLALVTSKSKLSGLTNEITVVTIPDTPKDTLYKREKKRI